MYVVLSELEGQGQLSPESLSEVRGLPLYKVYVYQIYKVYVY